MSRRTLVHLNALRAFESAARHQSFVAAAEELHVTPSAISQQVRVLEEYLGVSLFVRGKTGIALTPEATAAYPDIREGLARLAAGLDRMQSGASDRVVTMTVPTSFASKWLVPRIERFRERQPGLDLRLDTSNRLADYVADGFDIGVRYGPGGYTGMSAEKLLDEEVFPVCSPALLAAGVGDPARLAGVTLIHDSTIDFDPAYPTWRAWLAARRITGIDHTRGLHFNSSVLAIQAAIDGQGVALGRSVVVAADLRAGRLVRPFDGAEPTSCAYHVLYPPGALERPKVKAVRDWLFEEVARAAP